MAIYNGFGFKLSTMFFIAKSQFIRNILGVIFLFFVACDNPDERPDNAPYFQEEIGSYRIYEVNEDIYSTGEKNARSTKWFEKEEVMRAEKNSNGVSECLISYSTRTKTTDYWQKTKEYKVSIYPDKVVQNRDNEIITSLIFPYSPTVEWNGYQFFTLNDKDPRYGYLFHYEDINKSLQIDSLHFPTTLKVTERTDTTGPVLYRLGYKIYAPGVGLVMDMQADYDYLQVNGELVDYRVIDKGVRRIRKIIGNGRNK